MEWQIRLSGPAPEHGVFGTREQMFLLSGPIYEALRYAVSVWEVRGWEVLGAEIEARKDYTFTVPTSPA